MTGMVAASALWDGFRSGLPWRCPLLAQSGHSARRSPQRSPGCNWARDYPSYTRLSVVRPFPLYVKGGEEFVCGGECRDARIWRMRILVMLAYDRVSGWHLLLVSMLLFWADLQVTI